MKKDPRKSLDKNKKGDFENGIVIEWNMAVELERAI